MQLMRRMYRAEILSVTEPLLSAGGEIALEARGTRKKKNLSTFTRINLDMHHRRIPMHHEG